MSGLIFSLKKLEVERDEVEDKSDIHEQQQQQPGRDNEKQT